MAPPPEFRPSTILEALRGPPQPLEGVLVHVATLDHLIATKEAAGRAKDKLMAGEYRTLADEIRRQES